MIADSQATSVLAAAPAGPPTGHGGGTALDSHPQRLSPWFAVTGVLLLVALLAAAFVQARQYAMLNLTVQSQDDYLALSLYQMETEYLRLREQLRPSTSPLNQGALQLRYDIFVSRLSLLNTERARRLLARSEASAGVLHDLESFTRRADLYLGPEPRGPLSPEAARALLDDLLALDVPIHRMLLDASHQVAQQITQRQEQVRAHNGIGLALTGFLLAMVMAFAVLSLQQMRKLEQRRQRQQALADELREARIEAESASQAKSDFLADMSHELRTPLHGLLGMLSLVRDAPRDARANEWLATADESASHLLRLLDDMLDLSKLASGTMTLSPQAVNLATLMREVQALLLPAAQHKGLVLQSDLSSELPAHAWLDATRVKQVLFNLVGNAVKFSDTGAIVLRCHLVEGGAGQALLEFDVADTGIGMDADTLTRLFQRFSRADDPRARGQGGTGLGLAISRNLASLMGGEIVVRSTPGAGSVFSFRCPLQAATAPAPTAQPALARGTQALKVLVAEDHPVNRMFMAALLNRLGHEGTLVDNGLEALKAAQRQVFDLVLMDVHMPVMDGITATQAILSLPGAAGQVCIVALTADVFSDTYQRCLAAGAAEVVTKPVSLPMLQTLLDRHFGSRPASGSPALAPPADAATPRLIDPKAVQNVRELMQGDQAPSLYDSFFEQAEQACLAMREAMRRADTTVLAQQAHAVKGAALNLGLPLLADTAAKLNREAQRLSAAEMALAVQRFEEVTQATRALCRAEGLLPEAAWRPNA